MSTLVGIKNPSEYSEVDNSIILEKPAILNPVSARWYPSRGIPKVDIKNDKVKTPGYAMIPEKFNHPNPGRNSLGLVGGNEVSIASGNLVDTESELYGITRTLSRVPAKKYKPAETHGAWPEAIRFTERSSGKERTVATKPLHLPTIQAFSYPGIPAPKPLTQHVYAAPWRF